MLRMICCWTLALMLQAAVYGQSSYDLPMAERVELTAENPQLIGIGWKQSKLRFPADGTLAGGTMTGNPNLTFAEVGATGDTITRAAGSWIDDGFDVGETITITGTSGNNVSNAYVADVTATVLTLGTTDLAAEGPVNGVTIIGSERAVTIANYGSGTVDDGLQPIVSGLDIDGQYDGVGWTNGQGADDDLPEISDGVELDGIAGVISDCLIHGFRGKCATSRLPVIIRDNHIFNGYVGIYAATSDCLIVGNQVSDHRDYGLYVATAAGNVQSMGNHYFGCNNGGVSGGGTATAGAAALIGVANDFRSTHDTFADSYNGLECYGPRAQIVNGFFQHNTWRDAFCNAPGIKLYSTNIDVMRNTVEYNGKVGLEFWTDGDEGEFIGGAIELGNYVGAHTGSGGATAVKIAGDRCRLITTLVDNDGVNGSTGIVVHGAVKGFSADCRVRGFNESGDCLLSTNSADVESLDVVFRGDFADVTTTSNESTGLGALFDLTAGWTGSITIIDTDPYTVVTLTPGAAY